MVSVTLISPFSLKSYCSRIRLSSIRLNMLTSSQRHWVEFIFAMTEKEIKARYKHALLGFLWVLLNPLLQMLVIGFVFQFFVPVKVDNYFLFLFAGLLPWNFFASTLTKCTPAIVYERSLIQKAKFPREAIVLSIVLANLFHFLIALFLLLLAMVSNKILFESYSFLETCSYIAHMSLLLPFIIALTLLTSSLSLLTSALNVRFRDVSFAVQALVPLWFYGTPIIFNLNLMPEKIRSFFYLNPLTSIVEGFHWVLLNKEPGAFLGWIAGLAIIFVSSLIGIFVFRKESLFFDDWI
jgi:lipopolysaccharide transport system permease protein